MTLPYTISIGHVSIIGVLKRGVMARAVFLSNLREINWQPSIFGQVVFG
ncbi:hypothetical protein HMPREF1236_1443 [Streptococcus pyogenes GA40056]|nr:hypothetical protein HMPREF1236_1443 [Streptococcus pyogenes GA40056]